MKLIAYGRWLAVWFLIAAYTPALIGADQGVQRLISIPRPTGATLELTIEQQGQEPYRAMMDYLIKGKELFIRLHILNGKLTNRRAALKLGAGEYYVYHPLLGINAVSRNQLMRQFRFAGFNLDDMMLTLDPLHYGKESDWSSRHSDGRQIVASPANRKGCRSEFYFKPEMLLPYQASLCRESGSNGRLVELAGQTKWRDYILPKRLLYKQGRTTITSIRLRPTDSDRWKDMSLYSKDQFTRE